MERAICRKGVVNINNLLNFEKCDSRHGQLLL